MNFKKEIVNSHKALHNELTSNRIRDSMNYEVYLYDRFMKITLSYCCNSNCINPNVYFELHISKCSLPELYQICYMFSNISGDMSYINEAKFKTLMDLLLVIINRIELDNIIL